MAKSIHLLSGAGGDATGFAEAGIEPILGINHWQPAVDVFEANHPQAKARCADMANYPMRFLPRADIVWASVICWEVSPAGGLGFREPVLDEETGEWKDPNPEAFQQTRVTAWCVVRAAEARRYPVIAVENVVEFVRWPLFPTWIRAMEITGYRVKIVCVSSAHIGDSDNLPAPQWRDRIYIIFTLRTMRVPNLTPRPMAYCESCGDIRARQHWKKPGRRRVGKYRQQYVYRCPNAKCFRIVEPYVRPAADIIDWDDIGYRIGDRDQPLAATTMERIRKGLEQFPASPSVITLTHGRDGGDRSFAPDTWPMPTRTAKLGEGLLVPVGGTWHTAATSTDNPMRTLTTTESHGLVSPPFIVEYRAHQTASPVTRPLSTVTARGRHHALVVPYRRGRPRPTSEPVHTMATRSSAAIVQPAPAIEDCYFRMIKPKEQLLAQRFPPDYITMGSKADLTRMAGNAVSVNVARWIGEKITEIL